MNPPPLFLLKPKHPKGSTTVWFQFFIKCDHVLQQRRLYRWQAWILREFIPSWDETLGNCKVPVRHTPRVSGVNGDVWQGCPKPARMPRSKRNRWPFLLPEISELKSRKTPPDSWQGTWKGEPTFYKLRCSAKETISSYPILNYYWACFQKQWRFCL